MHHGLGCVDRVVQWIAHRGAPLRSEARLASGSLKHRRHHRTIAEIPVRPPCMSNAKNSVSHIMSEVANLALAVARRTRRFPVNRLVAAPELRRAGLDTRHAGCQPDRRLGSSCCPLSEALPSAGPTKPSDLSRVGDRPERAKGGGRGGRSRQKGAMPCRSTRPIHGGCSTLPMRVAPTMSTCRPRTPMHGSGIRGSTGSMTGWRSPVRKACGPRPTG